MSGQSKNQVLHYRLMGWWAGKLMTGLRIAMRASIDVNDSDAFDEEMRWCCVGMRVSLTRWSLPGCMYQPRVIAPVCVEA